MASTWFWLAAWAVVASGEKLAPHHAFARLLTEAERETLRAADTAMRVLSHGAEETVHELEKHRKFMLSALSSSFTALLTTQAGLWKKHGRPSTKLISRGSACQSLPPCTDG